ncbi:hypothetical protein Tco_1270962 [Tanacetum coccineum]
MPSVSTPLPLLPLFEEMEHDIDIPQDDIGSSQQEIVALCARAETLEQQDIITRDLLRISRYRITLLQLRAVAVEDAKTRLEQSLIRQIGDRVRLQRAKMT